MVARIIIDYTIMMQTTTPDTYHRHCVVFWCLPLQYLIIDVALIVVLHMALQMTRSLLTQILYLLALLLH